MSPHRRICVIFFCAYALLAVLAPAAHAFQPTIPGFTVIVSFPPDDLKIFLRVQQGNTFTTVQPRKEQIAWETRYRFTYSRDWRLRLPVESAALVVSSAGKICECPLPDLMLIINSSDSLFLNVSRQTVTRGQPPGRAVALASMRVLLTLLLEGALFFVFGYRRKRSWIAFASINLITQCALNAVLLSLLSSTGPFLVLYMIPLAVPVLIVELIAFAVSVNEHHRLRTVGYTVAANLFSLLLMLIALLKLPV